MYNDYSRTRWLYSDSTSLLTLEPCDCALHIQLGRHCHSELRGRKRTADYDLQSRPDYLKTQLSEICIQHRGLLSMMRLPSGWPSSRSRVLRKPGLTHNEKHPAAFHQSMMLGSSPTVTLLSGRNTLASAYNLPSGSACFPDFSHASHKQHDAERDLRQTTYASHSARSDPGQ